METTIADLRWKEVISVADGTRFGYVEDMEVDMESGQVRWCRAAGGCLACWAGRTTAISPGARCAALGKISFWWKGSLNCGHSAAGDERKKSRGFPPTAFSIYRTLF